MSIDFFSNRTERFWSRTLPGWTLLVLGLLSGPVCQSETAVNPLAEAPSTPVPKTIPPVVRNEDPDQIARGGRLYAQYCESCHGVQGVGAPNWRTPDSEWRYPPPPLNGTGHTWHHPTYQLRKLIKEGGPQGKSNMPGFKEILTDQQIDDIIAWFQSMWPEELYAAWYRKEQRARALLGE